MAASEKKPTREWYSVSVTSVAFVGLLGLMVVSFLIYKSLDLDSVEKRAENVISEASDRLDAIERDRRDELDQIKKDHAAAWEMHMAAITAFDEGDFDRALESGERSLAVLDIIDRQGEGSIRVLQAQGSVERRRGERGAWKRLRSHDTLTPGDWVKTAADGTAQLLFPDQSVFTLRQSTMVHLGGALGLGDDDATDVRFGRVELNTTASDRTVTTPRAQARVRPDSEAFVSFDRERGAGRFGAFTGGLEVTSESGEKREVEALQLVEQYNDRLAQVLSLPDKPSLQGPQDDHAINLAENGEMVLSWKPVSKARRYVLSISGNRLFATELVQNRRAKSSARIGLRREGQFYWRVAALDAKDNPGPWSDVRSFRAVSESRIEDIGDKEPPKLTITNTESFGTLVNISGRTEIGATLTINDENVPVKSDGSFQKMIELRKAGENLVEIVATDAWNNSTTRKIPVKIDAL